MLYDTLWIKNSSLYKSFISHTMPCWDGFVEIHVNVRKNSNMKKSLKKHFPVLSCITGLSVFFGAVECFNPLEGMWQPCLPMRTAREQPGCAVYLGRIYVSGGRDELLLELNTGEKFDPDTLRWTPVKRMTHKRYQVRAVC